MKTTKLKYNKVSTKDNIKLSFVDTKEINSTNNVKLIDLSSNIDISKKEKVKKITLDSDTNTFKIDKEDFPFMDNRLNITNVFKKIGKQNTPLFYKYKLSEPVRKDINIKDQFYLYNDITDQKAHMGDITYELVYIPRKDGLFELYIFFNNALNIYEKYYVFYKDTEGKIIKEYIYPEFAYYPRNFEYMGTDTLNDFEYTIENDTNSYIITVKSPIRDYEYHVDMVGYHEIRLEKVDELSRDRPWHIKIKNGYFEVDNISVNRMKFIYVLKEYGEELFDTYGPPYKRIKETPRVVGNKVIVDNPLIYDKKEINIVINDKESFKTEDFISIDKINGIIQLPKNISKHDKVHIEYTAIVENIDYSGYYNITSRKKLEFNCNPCRGNTFSYIGKHGAIHETDVFKLMKKPIHVYIKPTYSYYCDKMINDELVDYKGVDELVQIDGDISYKSVDISHTALTNGFCELITSLDNKNVQRGSNDYTVSDRPFWTFENEVAETNNKVRIYNPHLLKGQSVLITYLISNEMKLTNINHENTIFHTIEKYSETECLKDGFIHLGDVYCYPNSTIDDVRVYDIRQRGGGVIEELEDDIREIIEPDSKYYWDIGFWDGEESGGKVLCFRFEPGILKKNGGNVTLELIKKSIDKHIDAGADYLVEFVELNSNIEV